jgi:hypothetical protein
MDCDDIQVRYWDVFPKSVKVSLTGWSVSIPLSIRGEPAGDIEFEVADGNIAWVNEDGELNLGWQAGATVVMVYDSEDRESIRYVQVEVVDYGQGNGGGGYDGYGYEFPE